VPLRLVHPRDVEVSAPVNYTAVWLSIAVGVTGAGGWLTALVYSIKLDREKRRRR